MTYRGIAYDIRIRPGPNEWAWTIYLPNSEPMEGSIKGTRERATNVVHAIIDKWLTERDPPAPRTAS